MESFALNLRQNVKKNKSSIVALKSKNFANLITDIPEPGATCLVTQLA